MKKCEICQIDFDCPNRKEDAHLCFNCYEEKHRKVVYKKNAEKKVKNLHVIYCDGSSRGNPGRSGIGVVVKKDGEIIKTKSRCIGHKKYSEAGHLAVIESLQIAKEMGIKNILIKSDSILIVNQISRKWRSKKKHLKVLFDQSYELLKWFDFWKIECVKKYNNKIADSLAKKASS